MAKERQTKRVMLTDREIGSAIYQPLSDQAVEEPLEDPELTHRLYTIFGMQDYLDEHGCPRITVKDEDVEASKKFAMATSVTVEGRVKFYIRQGGNGQFFNPIGMFSEGKHNKQRHHAVKDEWGFHEVKARVFEHYMQFLKTKKTMYLRSAERETI